MFKHRAFIYVLSFLLISVSMISSAATQRGIVPVPIKDVAGNQVGLYKGSYALIIGVSDYTEGWQDLESVPSEVNDLVSALEAQGFHVVKVMNPDSEALEKSFKDFIAQYGFDPDNRLLFFFSGHGYTRQVGNITKGYLVPTDAPIPEHDPKGFKNKALSMKQIITWAEGDIESKHALFLFDSCFSGTILTSRSRPPIPRPIRDSTNHPVRQFISAGTAGQLVPSQSVFVPYFIRALKGDGDLNRDGYVTGTELGLYLRDQIMGGDTHQTPQVGKSFNPNFNEGDFVFSLKMAKLDVPVADEVSDEIQRKKAELQRLEEKRKKSDKRKELNEINRKLEEEKRLARERMKKEGLERQITDEEKRFAEEEKNLAEFYEKKENQLQMAKLMPREKPTAKSSGNCPDKMSFIPSGVFLAGRVDSLKEMNLNAFCMDQYEVTQAEYERGMGSNPSKFRGSNRPVEEVTWHEAKQYCEKIGKRLPTEWEWEKAAKAGTTTKYYWGNAMESGKANFCDTNCEYGWKNNKFDDGYKTTAPVGSFSANSFGLHDMAGNVWEWTASDYSDTNKVLRSGSWISRPYGMRSAIGNTSDPTKRTDKIGFRCSQ